MGVFGEWHALSALMPGQQLLQIASVQPRLPGGLGDIACVTRHESGYKIVFDFDNSGVSLH